MYIFEMLATMNSVGTIVFRTQHECPLLRVYIIGSLRIFCWRWFVAAHFTMITLQLETVHIKQNNIIVVLISDRRWTQGRKRKTRYRIA